MSFAIHPKAAEEFSSAAARLVSALRPSRPVVDAPVLRGSAANIPIEFDLGPGDFLGDVKMRSVSEGLIEFAEGGKCFRLEGDGAAEFARIVRGVARIRQVNRACDTQYVEDSLVLWLKNAADGSCEAGWIAKLMSELDRDVRRATFRVPLVGIHVEEDFQVGPYAVVVGFGPNEIDALGRSPSGSVVSDDDRKSIRKKYERNYQGKPCVEGVVVAVPRRIASSAFEAAEDVVRALLFVHPLSLDVASICSLGTYDCKRSRVPHVLLDSGSGFRARSWAADRNTVELHVPRVGRDQHLLPGLDAISQYLTLRDLNASQPSGLNDAAWEAAGIFTNGVASTLPRERLIGAVVAVEKLLLGRNEDIGRTVSQRAAVLLEGTLDQRRQTQANIREVYELRAAFIHHGTDFDAVDKREVMTHFLANAREVVLYCLANHEFATSDDLIQHLDDLCLGGGGGTSSTAG